ncbi:glycosyltransferase family 2 protein [Massilia sp. PAMC28688]|uniref:glycosyltransferase family 2 protein n=1 Tax=Massilia sp. PAMC28688 TaxID=2861283 RepID=UPI001C630E2F|nr:glycosyltransferase family 2 protein [Massilia sp. PAMC28688]QYF91759.1 glycosyltransferase family 2 protein [Massilia sp. PAMC28688]
MPTSSLISVIVSTYNRPDALAAVVEGLFTQTDRNFEILVVDDGSKDDTKACVAALKARSPVPLEHIWQPDDGFRLAMARNQGIKAARGDYTVFLDGDCVPQTDFVAQHRRLAQPGSMVTGSRILLGKEFTHAVLAEKRDLQSLGALEKMSLRLNGGINKWLQLIVRFPDLGREQKKFSFRRIKGCNLGIWRRDLLAVNGFDESFTGWGHEDADIVLRLHNAGVTRKDGAFATEVFHLWHPEAKRDEASSNLRIVKRRVEDKTITAAKGVA